MEGDLDIAREDRLLRIWPNPVSAESQIQWMIPPDFGTEQVEIGVYDVSGRLVRMLASESDQANIGRSTWDGRDLQGNLVEGGVYFVKLLAGEQTLSTCLIYVR